MAGHRLIRVSVDSIDVAPDVTAGDVVDVVASFPPVTADPRPSVSVVATVRVASLEKQQDETAPGPTPDAAVGAGASLLGATMAVTLDCTDGDALRVLSARDNARTLRLIAHPPGDGAPPPA